MKIEICIHCYNYEKRLTWMLSSILQQKGNVPEMVISISYLPQKEGITTESVITFFKEKGLNIIELPLEKGQESNRAIPRNIRAKETQADWILFADSDLVYDPYFFEDLKIKLEMEPYKNETRVFGADRFSLDIPFCIKYFEGDKIIYPSVIEGVSKIAATWPVYRISHGATAAGYFQLANVEAIRAKGGIYSGRKRDVWRSTRSDIQFRKHMGGRTRLETKPMFHLNHDRGGPEMQH